MFSGWKSIAVFLDDTPKGEKIGKCAAALAYRCGAHLIGIHGIEVADEINVMVKGRIVYAATPTQYRSEEDAIRRRFLTV